MEGTGSVVSMVREKGQRGGAGLHWDRPQGKGLEGGGKGAGEEGVKGEGGRGTS